MGNSQLDALHGKRVFIYNFRIVYHTSHKFTFSASIASVQPIKTPLTSDIGDVKTTEMQVSCILNCSMFSDQD